MIVANDRSEICAKAQAGNSPDEIATLMWQADERYLEKNAQVMREFDTILTLTPDTRNSLSNFKARIRRGNKGPTRLDYSGLFAEEPQYMLDRVIKKCSGNGLTQGQTYTGGLIIQ